MDTDINNYPSIMGLFENYYCCYIEKMKKSIFEYENISKVFGNKDNIESSTNRIIDEVLNEISEVAIYSLIDFFQFKKKGNESLSYEKFNSLFIDDNLIEEFHKVYPMVARMCETILQNYTKRVLEIFENLLKYDSAIYEFIGMEEQESLNIIALDIFKGDYHKKTFVVIVTMEQKKFVMKYRFNVGERILNIFKNIYCKEDIILPVVRTRTLTEEIAIQEFVKPTKLFSENEIEDYYYKFGLMTGVFTIIGTKDLHNENVISTKYGPYFIDMEVAITPQVIPKGYSLFTETLLFNCSEKRMVYGDIDLSAFSGKAVPMISLCVLKKGTADICIGQIEKIPELLNCPKDMKGKEIEQEKHIHSIVQGYDRAIQVYQKYKDMIIKELEKLNNYDYRVVLRNTAFYGTYLFNLKLPSYTKDKEKYKHLLSLLEINSIRDEKVIKEEIDCLKQNLIPYFTVSQFIDKKEVKKNFLSRLRDMSREDFERERHYLNMALKIEEARENTKLIYATPKERIKDEISRFLRLSIINGDLMYGVSDLSIHDCILDYRNEIYTFGGTLLFLQKYNPELGKKVCQLAEKSLSRKYISGLSGYQAGELLENLLNIENKLDYVNAKSMIRDQDIVDFSTYGSAILVLHILYRKTNKQEYIEDIKGLGACYLKRMKTQKLTGLFHGYAGDSLVMSVMAHYFDESIIYKEMKSLIIKENKYFKSTRNNWQDTREEMKDDDDMSAISYGAVGIVFSRLCIYLNKETPEPIKKLCWMDINRGIIKLVSQNRDKYSDDTIVNGFAGCLIVLKLIQDLTVIKDDELSAKIDSTIQNGQKILSEGLWRYPYFTNILNPAFFNGRMGTTFVLWYLSQMKDMSFVLLDYINGKGS